MAATVLRFVRRPRGETTKQVETAASYPVSTPGMTPAAVGSALNVSIGSRNQDWQSLAWEMYNRVGELRYYVGWRSSSCSRVRLIASAIDPDTGKPTGHIPADDPNGPRMKEIVRSIAGGPLGQSQLIKRAAESLSVPGEVWVAILDTGQPTLPGGTGQMTWLALTRDEVRSAAGGFLEIELPSGDRHQFNAHTDSIFRIWNPHARRAMDADSPVRAVLDALHEIVRTTKTISNASKSRLIGNGIVFVPQEMSLPATQGPTSDKTDIGEQTAITGTPAVKQLQELLWQVATTAYDDDDSMAALIPMFATVPGDQVKNVNHLTFDNSITNINIQVRNDAISRLAMGLDVSPERLLGLGSNTNHWCLDQDTQILTQDGWSTQDRLSIGDMVLTLNHETGCSEWQPVLDIYRADVVDEPMLSMESRNHSSLSTAAHRWPVVNADSGAREWRTSEAGFGTRDRIPVAMHHASFPSLDQRKYVDSFVRLVAAYTSDGSRLFQSKSKTTQYVRIAKFDPVEIVDLRRVCHDVFGRYVSEVRHPTRTRDGIAFILRSEESQELFNVTGEQRAVRIDFIRELTEAQLHLFLDALIEIGDGVSLRGGQRMFFQVEPSRLDAIELAAILAGYRVTRGLRKQQTGFGTEPLHWIQVSNARKWFQPYQAKQSWQTYSGVVWCPSTANKTWYARRNGHIYASGNTAWQVSDEDVRLHIVPPVETICQALNEQVVNKIMLQEKIDPNLYTLWYDASGLVADPDKSSAANAAFANGAINGEAYIEFLGLPSGSGYDFATMEGWQQWARDIVSRKPELVQTYLPMLGPTPGSLPIDITGPSGPVQETGRKVVEQEQQQSEAIQQPVGESPGQQEPNASRNTRGKRRGLTGGVRPLTLPEQLLVNRALGLAGKRRRRRPDHDRLRDVPMHQTHLYMPPIAEEDIGRVIAGWDDALTDEAVQAAARAAGIDPESLRAAVYPIIKRELTAPLVDTD
jgi:hypothetical protein